MRREESNPILTKADVKPSQEFLKVDGVFNCGAAKVGNEYILLCRVAESCAVQEDGFVCIPVFDEKKNCMKIEKLSKDEIQECYDMSDSRMIFQKNASGIKNIKYLTSISHLRIARSKDGIHFQVDEKPALPFSDKYEGWGMEDPRITYMEEEDRYFITYTAVSEMGAMPALLITRDFSEYERIACIFPPTNKDVVIFPKKIKGRYYAFHRPVPCEIGTPDIWLAASPDLKHWGEHQHVCGVTKEGWENGRVGGGVPPIWTEKGWLHIYHGADSNDRYCLGAMLTDLTEPAKILAKSHKPILEPEMDYERKGFFGEVVFSCGCIQEGSMLYLYYGAADDKIAMAQISMEEIMEWLKV